MLHFLQMVSEYIASMYIFYMCKEITVIFLYFNFFVCQLILQTGPQNYLFSPFLLLFFSSDKVFTCTRT